MRKIEQLMNAACKAKINFTRANTSVSYDDTCDESNVYLHGNHIATVGSNFLHIFDGGWQSVTTKSRLNALVNEFANPYTMWRLPKRLHLVRNRQGDHSSVRQ